MFNKLFTDNQIGFAKEIVQFNIKAFPIGMGLVLLLIISMIIGHVAFDVTGETYVTILFYSIQVIMWCTILLIPVGLIFWIIDQF